MHVLFLLLKENFLHFFAFFSDMSQNKKLIVQHVVYMWNSYIHKRLKIKVLWDSIANCLVIDIVSYPRRLGSTLMPL
jgi:hypothetical protein